MDIKSLLRELRILKGFDDESLARIAACASIENYGKRQVLLNVGDRVDSLGVLISGELKVIKSMEPNKEIILGPGQPFNLMSLITGEPAISKIEALSASKVIKVPFSSLSKEMAKAPHAAEEMAKLVTNGLVERNRDPDEKRALGQAKSKSLFRTEVTEEKPVLVLNMGSSSIKYAVFCGKKRCVHGLVERIGKEECRLIHNDLSIEAVKQLKKADHELCLRAVFDIVAKKNGGSFDKIDELYAVGHRVVHGGSRLTEATVITDHVKEEIEKVSPLAPLHNPLNLLGIYLCDKLLPKSVPQVAVFDTAFHTTLPEHAYRYAIPKELADNNDLRKFGFHGTSHKYVADAAASFLGEAGSSLKIVTCHLGNGCSLAAVDHGRSVDTSMGLTPLEGLVMGTRSGDIDPGLILHLLSMGHTRESLDTLLNYESGLKGMSGLSRDMRDLCKAAGSGHTGALLAISAFCYRVRKYIGAYAAVMNGVDALVFTGGIGENATEIRMRICGGLGYLNAHIDNEINEAPIDDSEVIRDISSSISKVKILVVPTDEERMIARETVDALERTDVSTVLRTTEDRPIPIDVYEHHVHLCKEHVEELWGKGYSLKRKEDLSQTGNFLCEERVALVGPKGVVENVVVLGPERPVSQVEVCRADEFRLGIDAPLRASGDVSSSAGILIRTDSKEIVLKEGVICAIRHIHMSPTDSLAFGIRDKDIKVRPRQLTLWEIDAL